MVQLSDMRMRDTAVAAALIVTGVVIKNSFEQMGQKDNVVAKTIGMGCFIGGWFLMARALASGKANRAMYFYGATLGVLVSVFTMKAYMGRGEQVPMLLPIVFASSWAVLGFFASDHLKGNQRWLGLVATACVLLSMLVMLPNQRKNCVVDGSGAYFFALCWGILIFVNSQR